MYPIIMSNFNGPNNIIEAEVRDHLYQVKFKGEKIERKGNKTKWTINHLANGYISFDTFLPMIQWFGFVF